MKKLTIFLALFIFVFAANGNGFSEERGFGGAVKSPHHYIVFEWDLQQKRLQILHHKIVNIQTSKGDKLSYFEEHGRHNFGVRLLNQKGEEVHREVVSVPMKLYYDHLEGEEFKGGVKDVEKAVFVVRVPVIEGATKLHMHLLQSSAESKAATKNAMAPLTTEEFVFDLSDALIPMMLPFKSAPEGEPELVFSKGSGDSANRVDILIFGDGYTLAEKPKFINDVTFVVEGFFSISPYKGHENFVKVDGYYVASTESGADHPPYNPACQPWDTSCCGDPIMLYDPLAGRFVDTYFGATYCASNIHRALVVDYNKVLSTAAAIPGWDQIWVLVNDSTWGGTGGGISVISMNQSSAAVMQHEHGHSFTWLSDEYEYGPVAGWCEEPWCSANVTNIIIREQIKWGPWVLETTPLPTPEDEAYNYLVGAFEGALYGEVGVWRPQNHCMMRELSEFCAICRQEYVLKLYEGGWGTPSNGIDNIEPGSEIPSSPDVFVDPGTDVSFSVDLLEPVGSALEVSWLVNGVVVPDANSNSFVFVPPDPGIYTVEIKTRDVTSLVHPAMAEGLLESGRVWNVSVISETVSTPILSGPSSGVQWVSYSYSGGSAVSSAGHQVQYFFDWGDGSDSGWLPVGVTGASKFWASAGVYSVKVQARCSIHTSVVSPWSAPISVVITGISVVSPNGGEFWETGSTQTIRWVYTGSPGKYVKVELLKGDEVNRTISKRTSTSRGYYKWKISSTQVPGDYQVRVTSTSNSACTDTGDGNFTIPPPTISVVSPNGGEFWETGSTQTIRWVYTGSPGKYVKVELLKGDEVNRTISKRTSTSRGYYKWKISSTQVPGDYQVRVTSTSGSCTDTSDNIFTISP